MLTLSILSCRLPFNDSRPRFGLGTADAFDVSPADLLNSMAVMANASIMGRSGTFTLQTSPGTYGWLAVAADSSENGLHIFDGLGFGGWSGAGLPGNNVGPSPDPTVSDALWIARNGTAWRFFRQDFANANPTPSVFTVS